MVVLKEMDFAVINSRAFEYTIVDVMIATDDSICCIAPTESRCFDRQPWYRSCARILQTKHMLYLYISISMLLAILNISSLVLNILITKSGKKVSLVNVTFISFNHLLCAVYLSIIWIADLYFSESFLVKSKLWRSGSLCFAAFYIMILFTVFTQFLMILLSISRLMVVLHPMKTNFTRTSFVLKCISCVVFISFILSLLCMFIAKHTSKTLPTNICFPFVDPSKSTAIMKSITWLTCINQTLTFIVTLFLNIYLVLSIKNSQKNITKSKLLENCQGLLVQLGVVTVPNVLCWVPANTFYITAFFMTKYSSQIIPWIAVIVVPMNSLICPVVFGILTLRKIILSINSKYQKSIK